MVEWITFRLLLTLSRVIFVGELWGRINAEQ